MQHIVKFLTITVWLTCPTFRGWKPCLRTKLKAQNLVKRHLNFKRWIPAFFPPLDWAKQVCIWVDEVELEVDLTKLKLCWRSTSLSHTAPSMFLSCPLSWYLVAKLISRTWWQNWSQIRALPVNNIPLVKLVLCRVLPDLSYFWSVLYVCIFRSFCANFKRVSPATDNHPM